MDEKIATPGWKPETQEEREAVVEHCRSLGMGLQQAWRFVRFYSVRRWVLTDVSVDQAAKEWIAAAKRTGLLPSVGDRLEKLAEDMRELRKTLQAIATLLSLVHGKKGETDIGRVIAEMLGKTYTDLKLVKLSNGVVGSAGDGGSQRELVEKIEGSEAGGESVGSEGV